MEHGDIPLSEELKLASEHPARVLKSAKNTEQPAAGNMADLLLLTDELNVRKVFVKGVEHLISIN